MRVSFVVRGMRIITLEDWPWAARTLVVLAQARANTMAHAVTTGAHIAWILLQMQPVLRVLGEEKAAKCTKSVDIALMTMPKGGAKASEFSKVVLGVLEGGGERTTLNILRSAMMGVPGMKGADLELAAHGEEICALLDNPDVEAVLKAPVAEATQKTMPFLALGFSLATQLQHRDFTTRHVVAANARAIDKMLVKHELASIAETADQLEALADGPRRAGNTLTYTPRIIGAVAAAFRSELPRAALVAECLAGDASVAFASPILDDARARLRQAAAPAS